jgi:preprotein translocase subunit SecA
MERFPPLVSFGGIARKIFGSANDRRVRGMRPRVEAVNAMENEMQALSDDALRARTGRIWRRARPSTTC